MFRPGEEKRKLLEDIEGCIDSLRTEKKIPKAKNVDNETMLELDPDEVDLELAGVKDTETIPIPMSADQEEKVKFLTDLKKAIKNPKNPFIKGDNNLSTLVSSVFMSSESLSKTIERWKNLKESKNLSSCYEKVVNQHQGILSRLGLKK